MTTQESAVMSLRGDDKPVNKSACVLVVTEVILSIQYWRAKEVKSSRMDEVGRGLVVLI
jgi:hypothetical protein